MTTTYPAALVVVRPFGRYKRGDLISDTTTVQAVLTGGNSALVVGTTAPATASSSTTTSTATTSTASTTEH